MISGRLELTASDVAFSISEKDLKTLDAEIETPHEIGQPRAIKALELGTHIRARGYNIFVTGLPGTGRLTAVKKVLNEYTPAVDRTQDIAFVCNFDKPLSPIALSFRRGEAREFKKDMHALVERVKAIVDLQLKGDSYKKRESALVTNLEKKENAVLSAFETELAGSGFQIIQVGEDDDQSTDIMPVFGGQQTTFEELRERIAAGEMTEAEWNERREKYYGLMDRMRALFDGLHESRAALEARLKKMREETIAPLIGAEIGNLRKKYEAAKTSRYLDEVVADILTHLYLFDKKARKRGYSSRRRGSPTLARYAVNVAVDNSETGRFPVIEENLPTYTNLFGSVETNADPQDETRTDFIKIRAGSFIQATGGFLILRAEDFIQEEESWGYLKRVMQTGKVEIQAQTGPMMMPGSVLKPEPVEVDVKVVMIGNELSYDLLYQADPDIQKLFKVFAEFDSSMPLDDDSLREYAAFVRKVVVQEHLAPIGYDGLAAVIEYGIRLSEYRNRLDTRFSLIADLLREASFAALREGEALLSRSVIERAVADREYRHNLPEEKLDDLIASGEMLVSVSGSAVGKVNGLAVHDRGHYSFGRPTVISARAAPGKLGVVNIEGVSGLSGEIYDKGVLIVEGFLRSRYARDFPLSVSATICFEQSYMQVDGDSASSAGIYALLSAIAGLPLRQDLAVTGSVNQGGAIQPVGGTTAKIEGFYQVCCKLGLSGSQGIIIPARNVPNLTLSREVQRAVADGDFHVFAISEVDEGMELLTGMKGAEIDAAIKNELEKMARLVKEFT